MKNLRAYMTVRNVVGYAAFCCLLLALTVTYIIRGDKIYASNALVLVKTNLYNSANGSMTASDVGADRTARSQIPLFESEDVIRSAIREVGIAKLYSESDLKGPLKPDDQAYVLARRNLSVALEPLTDLISVSFRNNDPETAAEFIRVLVSKFSQRYYEIYQNAGTVTFFQDQKEKAQADFASSSTSLAQYAAEHQVYKIEEQQRLLLAQRSKIASSLNATQGQIDQKRAEKESIPRQLSQMRVVGRLPQVIGLTQQGAGGSGQAAASQEAATAKADVGTGDRIDRLASDPPVLLVKVYQDTIANLVKLHTDLDGLTALEKSQAEQLKSLDNELNTLAEQAAAFEKLKLAADAAGQRVKAYTKRALDEQLTHAMNTNNLSSIQVVQSPTVPFKPVWPVPVLLLAAAFALCVFPVAGVVAYEFVKSSTAIPHASVSRATEPTPAAAVAAKQPVAELVASNPPVAAAKQPTVQLAASSAPASATVSEHSVMDGGQVAGRYVKEQIASKIAAGIVASKAAAELVATKVAAELIASRSSNASTPAKAIEVPSKAAPEKSVEPVTVTVVPKTIVAPVKPVIAATAGPRNPVQTALSSALGARKLNS